MVTLIEALNFRCLHYLKQNLLPFQAMVGPNATGKTTFLDVIGFLSDLVNNGLDKAIEFRTSTPKDLIWKQEANCFELAIEAEISNELKEKIAHTQFDRIRYEIQVGMDVEEQGVGLNMERVILKKHSIDENMQRSLFPEIHDIPSTIMSRKRISRREQFIVVKKEAGQNDSYNPETLIGYKPSYRTNPRRSALANLPADYKRFPVSTSLKDFLSSGIQNFVLNSITMRIASPPGQIQGFKPDGSNLPWVVWRLYKKDPKLFKEWIKHLNTALPDLVNVSTIQRADDKHRYLKLHYRGGLQVPSWLASDGTLRLLALTLPAYLKDFTGCYVIEEPENGIHPRAVETVIQSLSSVYKAQVLLATHSPVVLSNLKPKEILCFAKTEDGETDVVPGNMHPKLKNWQGSPNLSVLFAGGVLE